VINIEIILTIDDYDLHSVGNSVEDKGFPEEPFYSIAQLSISSNKGILGSIWIIKFNAFRLGIEL
jgi:hypothetical protein